MHQLNLVGGMIWSLCDGDHDPQQIAAALATEFAVEREEVEADVNDFITDLTKRGWLINGC